MDGKRVRVRAAIKGQLTRVSNFLNEAVKGIPELDVRTLENRYAAFCELLSKFDGIQSKIEENCEADADFKQQESERIKFEDEFYALDARFLKVINANKKRNDDTQKVKLPSIELPSFNGTITEYMAFMDVFESMIDRNKQLEDVDKLVYLKAALKGEASQLIEALTTTAANYHEALSILKARYFNARCIKQAHFQNLFNLPEVKHRSVKSLRLLMDTVQSQLSALSALGENVIEWNNLLVYLVSSKLDYETRKQFEMEFSAEEPEYADLKNFINSKCAALERAQGNISKTISDKNGSQDFGKTKTNRSFGATVENSIVKGRNKCYHCDEEHKIMNCPQFLKLSPNERYCCAKRKELCVKCLRPGHRWKTCMSHGCSKCSKNHHSLLHFGSVDGSNSNNQSKVILKADETVASQATTNYGSVTLQSNVIQKNFVLLFTAIVRIRSPEGYVVNARALVDPGSQVNFVTDVLLRRLKVGKKTISCVVDGVGEKATQIKSFVDMEIRSRCNNFGLSDRFLVLARITKNLPQSSIKLDTGALKKLDLADPYFYRSGEIELLLSNEVFVKIMKSGEVLQLENGLKAFDTEFGYLIGGSLSERSTFFSGNNLLCSCVRNETEEIDIRQFWELENILNEKLDEKFDIDKPILVNYERDEDGRFIVRLPVKSGFTDFSYSNELAMNRFRYLEKKFKLNKKYAEDYKKVMLEYINKQFVELVSEEEENALKYYLPHHGVVKESSSTTKLRVVFDGSAAPINCHSLNSILITGQKLQNDLVRTLLKFRTYAIAFVADIEKMYCQIKVHKSDRDLLRFCWRFSVDEPIKTYRLVSLPFGLNCSPNLAIGCLKELARLNLKTLPKASEVLLWDSYMDDILSGADDVENAKKLANDLSNICKSGGFQLRKWTSNSSDLLEYVGESSETKNFEAGDTKILGLRWSTDRDYFGFTFKWNIPNKLTKRSVLSFLAGIFDPMGFISPVVILGKILLQEIWLLKLEWDQELPDNVVRKWNKLFMDLENIDRLDLNRYVGSLHESKILAFCDASEKAYGVVVYLRCEGRLSLVFSKSRVAPLKTISLARLELCAALLGAKAVKYVSDSLGIGLSDCVLFSDSQIVLAWISKPSYNWKCFVANRVAEIQEISSECRWTHVKSKDNPADLISRGCLLSELIQNKLWWNGPSWLIDIDELKLGAPTFETKQEFRKSKSVLIAMSSTVSNMTPSNTNEVNNEILLNLIDRFSDFRKVKRVYAWIRRFVSNIKPNKPKELSGLLSVTELDDALLEIVKFVQHKHFLETIDRLKSGKLIKTKDSLVSLNPFLDEKYLLRVGRRLRNSQLPYAQKHPIILPKNDIVTQYIIREEHVRCNHLGTVGLINILRKQYWIINSRSTVRGVLRKCLQCFRCHPMKGSQLMGDLPVERIEGIRAFNTTGIDLCGPFYVRPTRKRGNSTTKCFVALFICLATKAIHLETVFDLSADSFLATFRRFCGRRGIPKIVYTDNATNFVGARNILEEWYDLLRSTNFEQKFQQNLANDRILWKFIPPRTPTFGGLWESNIKSFKSLFKKCAGESRLTFEEFSTLLVQVEAALNSRPLSGISESPDDLDGLTPGHFLVGQPLKMLPCPLSNEFDGRITKRWAYIQEIFRNFWRRWSVEYLQGLQIRNKNQTLKQNIKVGDIGLLVDDALPPLKWKLGRVVEVFFGKDDLVRVITIKTENGVLKRGVERFCKFEIE